jgi:hypothetical protein
VENTILADKLLCRRNVKTLVTGQKYIVRLLFATIIVLLFARTFVPHFSPALREVDKNHFGVKDLLTSVQQSALPREVGLGRMPNPANTPAAAWTEWLHLGACSL